MITQALRESTAEAHRRAESADLQRHLIRGSIDSRMLARYLAQLHAVHEALERGFDQHADVGRLVGWSDDLRHSRNLSEDLTALREAPEVLDVLPATGRLLGEIESAAADHPVALVGFFYVLEGSMNGNRFIARALRKSAAGERCQFTYFDPYGDEQSERWSAFKTAIDRIDLDSAEQRIVIDAAHRMFDAILQISIAVTADTAVVLT